MRVCNTWFVICLCLYDMISVCLNDMISVCLNDMTSFWSKWHDICLSISLDVCLSEWLDICLSIWLDVCLSEWHDICLSVWCNVCLFKWIWRGSSINVFNPLKFDFQLKCLNNLDCLLYRPTTGRQYLNVNIRLRTHFWSSFLHTLLAT